MSSALSNSHTISTPFRSKRGLSFRNENQSFRCPSSPLRNTITTSHGGNRIIKAMGADGRESAQEHLQRLNKQLHHHQQYQTPKRRFSQSAPVGLWDRFPTARTVQQMMETMERIMEDPFAYSGSSFPSLSGDEEGGLGGYRRGRTPWEIKEGDGEYKMRFDMPGMTKKDVKVWVEERMLVVKAEKLPEKSTEGGKVAEEEEDWTAKSDGRYNSRIALPENVEVEKIKAEVKDGVLYITIPKASKTAKVLDI